MAMGYRQKAIGKDLYPMALSAVRQAQPRALFVYSLYITRSLMN